MVRRFDDGIKTTKFVFQLFMQVGDMQRVKQRLIVFVNKNYNFAAEFLRYLPNKLSKSHSDISLCADGEVFLEFIKITFDMADQASEFVEVVAAKVKSQDRIG